MWRNAVLFVLGLFVLSASLAKAAPAPQPRPATAEVILAVGSEATGKVFADRLRSQVLLENVIRVSLPGTVCFKGEANPARWLGSHLRIETIDLASGAGKALRVRLDGCSARDAIKVLNAVVDATVAAGSADQDLRQMQLMQMQQRIEVMQRLQARGGRVVIGAAEMDEMKTQMAQLEAQMRGAQVVQRPRLVPSQR